MKKSLTLLAGVLIGATASWAQLATVGTPQPILKGMYSQMYNPVLSADGQRLLFSAEDFSNLRMHDFADNSTVTISPAQRAGLNATFTADGSQVVYVAQTRDENGLNWRRVCSYNIARGANTDLSSPARMIETPVVSRIAGEGIEYTANGALRKAGKKVSVGVSTRGSQLIVVRNGVEKAYNPVPCQAGYTWASLSPDGTKAMFLAAGVGVIITDLDGNILSRPGNYECPVWFGNNHIVAMNATDDGHQLHSSQILLMTADGTTVQPLTRPESMAMFPTASFDAGKVVYNTIDGLLFQMDVKLK